MKNKKNKKWLVIAIIVVIIIIVAIMYFNSKNTQSESTTTTTVTEVSASTQSIQNTLTSSGQILASSTEKLTLSTSKYFKTMCVEENDLVKKGESILMYSNGTYFTADYDCIVTSYSVPETGSICTSSNYIEVENIESLTMSLNIDETQINSVQKGTEVSITVNALEDKTYKGTITKINSVGTYASSGSSFTATVTFENDGNIKPGMSASCTIILESVENAIAVPIEAVQTNNNDKYVVVVNSDGTTTNTTIETGISNDSYVEIKSGLTGNEKIQMIKTTTTTNSNRKSSSSSSSNSGMSSFGGTQMSSSSGMPSGSMPGGMQQ